MIDTVRQSLLVACIASVVLFTNLGGPRLWDRDEPRNAGCAAEMLARFDWVTPVFNGELRSHKPVLLYWLMMGAYSLFGVSEFAARFPSAVLAVATTLCTWAMARRLFDGSVGLWAGIALGTSLMFGVAGRAATPDSLLIFCSTLALTIYVYGTFGSRRRDDLSGPKLRSADGFFPTRWSTVVWMYGAMGLGVLAKGPVGLILPTAVIGMFLLIMRRPQLAAQSDGWKTTLVTMISVFEPRHFLKTCWSMRPITALAVSLLISAPWYIWVGLRTDGEFLRGFFIEHNVGRAMHTMEGHDGGLLYFPLTILIGFFPWSVFSAPLAIDLVGRLRCDERFKAGTVLAICWVGVYVGLFSLASTKLPSYVTPCYPGVALLVGCFVERLTQGKLRGAQLWRRLALGTLALVGLVMLVAVPIAARELLPSEPWVGAIGLIPLVGAAMAWILIERERLVASAAVLSFAAMLFSTVAFGVIADRVSRQQQNHELLATIDHHGNQSQIAAFGLLEPTWVFYSRRPVREIAVSGDAQWMGNWIESSGQWVPQPPLGLGDIAKAKEDWLIITTEQHLQRLKHRLPDYETLAECPYFLRDGNLVVLGRVEPATEPSSSSHAQRATHATNPHKLPPVSREARLSREGRRRTTPQRR